MVSIYLVDIVLETFYRSVAEVFFNNLHFARPGMIF